VFIDGTKVRGKEGGKFGNVFRGGKGVLMRGGEGVF
jgi:hypothetical protein